MRYNNWRTTSISNTCRTVIRWRWRIGFDLESGIRVKACKTSWNSSTWEVLAIGPSLKTQSRHSYSSRVLQFYSPIWKIVWFLQLLARESANSIWKIWTSPMLDSSPQQEYQNKMLILSGLNAFMDWVIKAMLGSGLKLHLDASITPIKVSSFRMGLMFSRIISDYQISKLSTWCKSSTITL